MLEFKKMQNRMRKAVTKVIIHLLLVPFIKLSASMWFLSSLSEIGAWMAVKIVNSLAAAKDLTCKLALLVYHYTELFNY